MHRTFDIGGPDVLTYAEMMQRYAAVAGLPRRLILPVPLFTPSLSSHWVGLVTPVPAGIARPLVESLRNTVVCREHDIAAYVPDPPEGLLGFDEAVGLAVQRVQRLRRRDPLVLGVGTRRALAIRCPPTPTGRAAASTSTSATRDHDRRARAGVARSSRGSAATTAGTPSRWPGRSAAGWTGWSAGSACAAAGGTRAGSASATPWTSGGSRRASAGRLLRLRAEMRLPGLAWLEFHVEHDGPDGAPCSGSGRPSPRTGWPATSTGGRSPRSTASSSAA